MMPFVEFLGRLYQLACGDDAAFTQCDLSGARFYGAQLFGLSFSHSNLNDVDFSDADLSYVDFKQAKLQGALFTNGTLDCCDMQQADLTGASLYMVHLDTCNLRQANCFQSSLRKVTLKECECIGATFAGASLINVTLARCKMNDVDFTDVRQINLTQHGCDWSGAKGLRNASDYLREHFTVDDQGLIAYKVVGLMFNPPDHWNIVPGAVLTEVVNPQVSDDCGSGVNVASARWIISNTNRDAQIWRVRIRTLDLADTVVPRGTDGKIRAARVELVEVVTYKDLVKLVYGTDSGLSEEGKVS